MNLRPMLRPRRAVGLALAVCAVATAIPAAASARTDFRSGTDGPALAVQEVDLRSPDARDAALPPSVDLRSPDARDAARLGPQPQAPVDLRSPDSRDATTDPQSAPSTQVSVEPTIVPVVDNGSQTLAIVFSSTALLIALVAVGVAAFYRRRPRWSAS